MTRFPRFMVRITPLIALLAMSTAAAAADKVQVDIPAEKVQSTRDPFKRQAATVSQESPRGDLETVPVEQMHLIGIVSGPVRLRAMISVGGKTYFISENQKVGIRQGVVARITESAVIVREKVVNILGKEEQVDFMIRMGNSEVASGLGTGTGTP